MKVVGGQISTLLLWRWNTNRMWWTVVSFNTPRPRQHGCHFPDGISNCILLNENVCIAIKISLTFVPKDPNNNIPALVQIMAWRRPGDKPLSEPMVVSLLTHISHIQLSVPNSQKICHHHPQLSNSTIGRWCHVYLVQLQIPCRCIYSFVYIVLSIFSYNPWIYQI